MKHLLRFISNSAWTPIRRKFNGHLVASGAPKFLTEMLSPVLVRIATLAPTIPASLIWPLSYIWWLNQSSPLRFFSLLSSGRHLPDEKYASEAEEELYWKEAESGQRVLRQSDARYAGVKVRRPGPANTDPYVPPLVMYYTPALLPKYRDAPRRKRQIKQYHISPKNYCKWHWMVFPGEKDHPTVKQATKLRSLHTPADLWMIDHISRMRHDDKVFPRTGQIGRAWTPKYQKIWLDWLDSPERIIRQ